MGISVFVTYCWENDDHDGKVLQLTNHLRKKGFNAEMDKLKSQEETAIDFIKMMNEAMTRYNKVIVILSKNYKSKAEMFKGGVGIEYSLIIKDIVDNPNKYILVSFEGVSDEISPLSLKGREIVDLQKGESAMLKLYSKLMDVPPFQYAEIGQNLPQLEQVQIPDFNVEVKHKGIEFEKINEKFIGDSLRFRLYLSCHRRIKLLFRNNSGKTVNGCHVDLSINPKFLYHIHHGDSIENHLSTSIENKIFPNQTFETQSFDLEITNENVTDAGKEFIRGKVYSDIGETSFEIAILDCITIEKNYTKTRIELDDFLPPF